MEFKSPAHKLFQAIAFIDHPGVSGDFSQQLKDAVEEGANVNGLLENGKTPLTEAIGGGYGSPTAVRLLLEMGADPSLRDQEGWSPWGVYCMRRTDQTVAKQMAAICELLDRSDPDRSDEKCVNAMRAIAEGDIETVKIMGEEGFDFSSPLVCALEMAVSFDNIELARYFLTLGLDANFVRGGDVDAPLVVKAAGSGQRAMVELLVEHGALLNAYGWGDEQRTAERVARDNNHLELANWLHSKAAAAAETA